MLKFLKLTAVSLCISNPAMADGLGLGRAALPEEVAAWDTDIRPDGAGLPEGRGNVETGEEVFAEACAICHGDFGEAVDRWPVLAGGHDTLSSERPVKTIGSYWPYLSTVFDYIQRAMPFGNARSLSNDDVYAITAYLLYVNDIVDEEFELSHENFMEIPLPNEGGFFFDDRPETELSVFSGEVCMQDCKGAVEITGRALVLDVTPESDEEAPAEQQDAAQTTPAPEPVATLDPALVAAGAKVFKKCKACHQIGEGAKNRSGPQLNGILGRTAGTIDGFRYSKAMTGAGADGLIWNDETLGAFLTKPRAYLKGTKMSFAGLKKPADIEAILVYLQSVME
ncbi:MAG: c-type cytochrome [Marinosulfonomonas sp.]|nr:c-type cytochrome [Marinosulfonomonas sp.]